MLLLDNVILLILTGITSLFVFAIDFVFLTFYILLEICGLNILPSVIFEERKSTIRQTDSNSKEMSYTIK